MVGYDSDEGRDRIFQNFIALSVSFLDFFPVLLPQPTIRQRTMLRRKTVEMYHSCIDESLKALTYILNHGGQKRFLSNDDRTEIVINVLL